MEEIDEKNEVNTRIQIVVIDNMKCKVSNVPFLKKEELER